MRLVADQLEILEAEGEEILHRRIDLQGRQRQWLALKLQVGLLLVVHVEVRIAQGVHEVARREIADLRHHHGQQSVGSDVEGHAEKDVGAALVELARSEEHRSERQSLMRTSYAVVCLKQKNKTQLKRPTNTEPLITNKT